MLVSGGSKNVTRWEKGLPVRGTSGCPKTRYNSSIVRLALGDVDQAITYMQDVYEYLADRAHARVQSSGSRVLIGIVGCPGSGKSTTSKAVASALNARGVETSVLPMDGYHYYRHELEQFADPVEAFKRRGAPFTFNARKFVDKIREVSVLSTTPGVAPLKAPSFDHALKDPKEDDIIILPSSQVILVEGNYLLLEEAPWSELPDLLDESWFIACNLDEAMARVQARQVNDVGLSVAESQIRIDTNDRPNAELVDQSRARASLVVPSLPFKP